ncbi:MAG TPA: hypothetical protein PKY59_06700 [Pyrinomonadaceae bacterium]|nr:hypothetical protein [Pyrinomonadaceae bacterium]
MNNNEFRKGVIHPVECFKEGWELIKNEYWMFFAISLVGALIGGISMYILLGAMMCGMYYCFLQKIDGNPVSIDGLWKGFGVIAPSLIVTVFIVVPMFVLMGIIYAPLIMAAAMGSKLSADELTQLFFGAFAVDVVIAVIMTCFHTLLLFSFHLIIDRKLGGIQAMLTSAKAVWQNLSGVAGLLGVAILLSIPAMLTCGIGVYFLLPIMLAGYTVAYRKMFPAISGNFNPPPPNAYL